MARSSTQLGSFRTTPGAVASGSLLGIEGLPPSEIRSILARAEQMRRARLHKASRRRLGSRFAGKRVALLFYEPSTRTRVSFEFASKTLGATTSIISAAASSIEKGESLLDTGYTLRSLGADAIVIRHPSSGAPHLLARYMGIPIINAGDGMHEHPTQALLDAYTLLSHYRSLKGLKVVLVGDILHSRVARSNIYLLSSFGAQVVLCGPAELLPDLAATLAPRVEIVRDLDDALRHADVVMALRMQKERLAGLSVDVNDYVARYQLTLQRLAAARPKALVMHPGPMVRGMEITNEVADGNHSVILEQVANGVFVRMAVLERALKS